MKIPLPKFHYVKPGDSLFANPIAMNDEQLREYTEALATAETWAAYCKKLGVSIHSPRPTQPWDKP